jgi:methionyl-tRNA formyltransferase
MKNKFKSVVIGSGSIAQSCIFNLLKNQFEVKVFEFAKNNSSTLKGFCEKNKVDYTTFNDKESLNNTFLLIDEKTLVVSASNRYLFPEEVILNNNLEIINYHSSLLPKYPGRNAEAWAIFEGEVRSGITWHKVVKDIDEGEIILQKCTRLSEHTTSLSLLKEFNILAIQAFEIIINDYQKNGISYSEQKGFDKFNLRYSWMRPNDAILDTYWTEVRISQFLRAFDYGVFKNLGSFIVSDFDKDQNFYEYVIHNKANFEAKFSNNYLIEKETKIFELRIDER